MPEFTNEQLAAIARQLLASGDAGGAEGLARRALADSPEHRESLLILARIAAERNDPQAASAFMERAAAAPRQVHPKDLLSEEVAKLLTAAEADANNPCAWFEAGKALQEARDADRAEACYRRALALEPRYTAAMNNLGLVLNDRGETEAALAALRTALDMPGGAAAYDNYLYVLHFLDGLSADTVAAEHRQWAARCAGPLAPADPQFPNVPDPGKRLRVGYVSPHFHRHPVGRLLLKLFENADPREVEVFCYSGGSQSDDVTALLQLGASHWIDIRNLSDAALADRIRADGIDILVDLTMHMAGNRLLAFALRPAPVQITYLAYVSTTGLPTMDYRLTDPHLDPAPRRLYVEESLMLPESYWCYSPPADAPPISPLPAHASGHITFASLNAFCKVSPRALDAWAAILRNTEGAKLVIHAYPGGHRQRVLDRFAAAGVDPARIRFFDRLAFDAYLRMHHQIDIALDPFAYAGGTTTLDAAYMGVPTVTLAGAAPHTRGGASILRNLGLSELIAEDAEGYIQAATRLAADTRRLAALRGSLRGRLVGGVLCDGRRFAQAVTGAYRRAWGSWCSSTRT